MWGKQKPTRAEAITAAGQALAHGRRTDAAMSARELAEAAWSVSSPYTVDELEDRIRAERGLPRIDRQQAS